MEGERTGDLLVRRTHLNGAFQSTEESSNLKEKNDHPDGKTHKRHPFRCFQSQDSLITTLRHNNPHFETLVNCGIHIMITLCVLDIVKNSFDKERLYLDFDAYFIVFGPFVNYLTAIQFWCVLMVGIVATYYAFQVWVKLRPLAPRFVDFLFITLYLIYNIAAHFVIISYIIKHNLAPAPALFLSVEQTRLTMKTYSFIRENAYKVLWPWKETDETGPAVWYKGQLKPKVGSFGQYFYFLFVPTFLYRDEYPRTPAIRWRYALQYFLEFVSTIVVTVMVLKNFIRPTLMGLPQAPIKSLVLGCVVSVCFGTFYLFMANACLLHAWMNFGAELTRFGDRRFYEDWWTCIDFQTFYRKWNLVVYDWIHSYIYRDLTSVLKFKWYRKLAALPPIFISSVFHEYMISVGTKYFFPVLTFQFFCLGGIVYFVRPQIGSHRLWNALFLIGISIGSGLMIWGYSVEYYARIFCPSDGTFADAFNPHSFFCFHGDGPTLTDHV